jgi:hypothetical protein
MVWGYAPSDRAGPHLLVRPAPSPRPFHIENFMTDKYLDILQNRWGNFPERCRILLFEADCRPGGHYSPVAKLDF